MAKMKTSKGAGGVPNKPLYSRISFLYQAAAYLATREPQTSGSNNGAGYTAAPSSDERVSNNTTSQDGASSPSHALSQRLISDLRSVSLKTQIRLPQAMKHSICKRCDILLIGGSTCEAEIENKSKGGAKPWADVLVLKCMSCGCERRFPIEAKRQTRRPHRPPKERKVTTRS